MDATDDLVAALTPVVAAFRELGIRHFVGGSVASSFHGASRSTLDVDVVCVLAEADIEPIVQMLGTDFYVSPVAMRDAIRRKSCFNLIHFATAFKVDVFVSRGRPFDQDAMRRATTERLGVARTIDVPIASPEDSIVSKLEWYRLTHETSERQWQDMIRVYRAKAKLLDRDYLQSAAESTGVADLYARLLAALE